MAFSSSLPISKNSFILLSFFITFFFLVSSTSALLKYHNGPLLKGEINLSILWYGKFPPQQKPLFLNFINSLPNNPDCNFDPQVSKWWKKVESYQALAENITNPDEIPSIKVNVVNNVDDESCSQGQNLSQDSIPVLVNKAVAAGGAKPNSVAVVFIAKDVGLEGYCTASEKCSSHGALGKQLYIVVKDPKEACPGKCGWPFFSRTLRKNAEFTINPPNVNEGIDLSIIHAASALASTVTNPYGNGFYLGVANQPITEIGQICSGVFGTGAFPGFTGTVHLDPRTSGGFNAHGLNNTKFLLPGLWNPQGKNCWTIM